MGSRHRGIGHEVGAATRASTGTRKSCGHGKTCRASPGEICPTSSLRSSEPRSRPTRRFDFQQALGHPRPRNGTVRLRGPQGITPGDAGSFNAYAYADNNPVALEDPSGTMPVTVYGVSTPPVARRPVLVAEATQRARGAAAAYCRRWGTISRQWRTTSSTVTACAICDGSDHDG